MSGTPDTIKLAPLFLPVNQGALLLTDAMIKMHNIINMRKYLRLFRPVVIVLMMLITIQLIVTHTSILTVPAVTAGGESFQLFRGPGGPYEIIVGVQPHKPKVGIMHISVSVVEPGTNRPIDGVKIMVVAHDSQGKPIYQAPALQDPQEPKFYDANITFYEPGQWSLNIKVDSEARGPGEAMVPLFISSTSLDPGIEGLVVLLMIVGGISGGVVYLTWSSRRKRTAALSQ